MAKRDADIQIFKGEDSKGAGSKGFHPDGTRFGDERKDASTEVLAGRKLAKAKPMRDPLGPSSSGYTPGGGVSLAAFGAQIRASNESPKSSTFSLTQFGNTGNGAQSSFSPQIPAAASVFNFGGSSSGTSNNNSQSTSQPSVFNFNGGSTAANSLFQPSSTQTPQTFQFGANSESSTSPPPNTSAVTPQQAPTPRNIHRARDNGSARGRKGKAANNHDPGYKSLEQIVDDWKANKSRFNPPYPIHWNNDRAWLAARLDGEKQEAYAKTKHYERVKQPKDDGELAVEYGAEYKQNMNVDATAVWADGHSPFQKDGQTGQSAQPAQTQHQPDTSTQPTQTPQQQRASASLQPIQLGKAQPAQPSASGQPYSFMAVLDSVKSPQQPNALSQPSQSGASTQPVQAQHPPTSNAFSQPSQLATSAQPIQAQHQPSAFSQPSQSVIPAQSTQAQQQTSTFAGFGAPTQSVQNQHQPKAFSQLSQSSASTPTTQAQQQTSTFSGFGATAQPVQAQKKPASNVFSQPSPSHAPAQSSQAQHQASTFSGFGAPAQSSQAQRQASAFSGFGATVQPVQAQNQPTSNIFSQPSSSHAPAQPSQAQHQASTFSGFGAPAQPVQTQRQPTSISGFGGFGAPAQPVQAQHQPTSNAFSQLSLNGPAQSIQAQHQPSNFSGFGAPAQPVQAQHQPSTFHGFGAPAQPVQTQHQSNSFSGFGAPAQPSAFPQSAAPSQQAQTQQQPAPFSQPLQTQYQAGAFAQPFQMQNQAGPSTQQDQSSNQDTDMDGSNSTTDETMADTDAPDMPNMSDPEAMTDVRHSGANPAIFANIPRPQLHIPSFNDSSLLFAAYAQRLYQERGFFTQQKNQSNYNGTTQILNPTNAYQQSLSSSTPAASAPAQNPTVSTPAAYAPPSQNPTMSAPVVYAPAPNPTMYAPAAFTPPAQNPTISAPAVSAPAPDATIPTPAASGPAPNGMISAPVAFTPTVQNPTVTAPAAFAPTHNPSISAPGVSAPANSAAISAHEGSAPANGSAISAPATSASANSTTVSAPATSAPAHAPAVSAPATSSQPQVSNESSQGVHKSLRDETRPKPTLSSSPPDGLPLGYVQHWDALGSGELPLERTVEIVLKEWLLTVKPPDEALNLLGEADRPELIWQWRHRALQRQWKHVVDTYGTWDRNILETFRLVQSLRHALDDCSSMKMRQGMLWIDEKYFDEVLIKKTAKVNVENWIKEKVANAKSDNNSLKKRGLDQEDDMEESLTKKPRTTNVPPSSLPEASPKTSHVVANAKSGVGSPKKRGLDEESDGEESLAKKPRTIDVPPSSLPESSSETSESVANAKSGVGSPKKRVLDEESDGEEGLAKKPRTTKVPLPSLPETSSKTSKMFASIASAANSPAKPADSESHDAPGNSPEVPAPATFASANGSAIPASATFVPPHDSAISAPAISAPAKGTAPAVSAPSKGAAIFDPATFASSSKDLSDKHQAKSMFSMQPGTSLEPGKATVAAPEKPSRISFDFTKSEPSAPSPLQTNGWEEFLKGKNQLSNLSTSLQPTSGSPVQSVFASLNPSRAASPATTNATVSGAETDDKEEADGDTFDKDAQLELGSANAGEEDEELLFSVRAKIQEFASEDDENMKKMKQGNEKEDEEKPKSWRVRGVGELRVLRNKESGKTRVVVRQDKSARVLLNAGLLEGASYGVAKPKLVNFTVAAPDGTLSRWLIQVGKEDVAKKISSLLEENKKK